MTFQSVIEIVEKVKGTKKLAGVGVDAIGIGGIVDALAKIGVTQENKLLAGVRQGISLMGAIKTVERKLVDGSFKHGGQALMTWMRRQCAHRADADRDADCAEMIRVMARSIR